MRGKREKQKINSTNEKDYIIPILWTLKIKYFLINFKRRYGQLKNTQLAQTETRKIKIYVMF